MSIYLHMLLISKFIISDFYSANIYDSENVLHALFQFFVNFVVMILYLLSMYLLSLIDFL